MDADPEVGSVASKMLNFFDRSLIDAAGDGLGISGVPLNLGQGKPDGPRFNEQTHVFGACAGAALYRRSCLQEVGLLDEDFASHFRKLNLVISHFEDIDLAYRLQLAGYRCLYVPTAVCYHKRGATVGRAPAHLIQSLERNLVNLYVKDVPLPLLLRLAPMILAARSVHFLRAVMSGRGVAFIQGVLRGLGQVPANLPKQTEDAIIEWCLTLAGRLECRDYMRLDWRLDKNGVPHLLEVNPNPGWCWDGHLAKMAAATR